MSLLAYATFVREAPEPAFGAAPAVPAARMAAQAGATMPSDTIAATRLHVGDASKPPDLRKIRAFVDRVAPAVDRVAVAVGVPGVEAAAALGALGALAAGVREACGGAAVAVDVVPVEPWGGFVPALNALTAHAARSGYAYVLFASVEANATPEAVACLREELDAADAFVAGAALPGHAFQVGDRALSGVTAPWNTLALWRVPRLALLGFPLVGEGLHPGADGGVEEVSAIHALARLQPDKATALLVAVPGVSWETDFDDPKRAEWHAKKMASKESRPAKHLALLGAPGAPPAVVRHVRPAAAA